MIHNNLAYLFLYILLSSFKTFKYLKVNKRLYVIWQTLDRARGELITFLAVFLIILVGFVLMAWITFGVELAYFNGFVSSLGTCWEFIIGNPPDYFELYKVNRALGPIVRDLLVIFNCFSSLACLPSSSSSF
jgi:hypothetical protein